MGASGWRHVTPYDPDLRAVLARLRQQVFDEHDYYWPAAPDSDSGEPEWPASMAELTPTPDGTHSILDIHRVIDAGAPDDFATLRPITTEEELDLFGTTVPTTADFERLTDHSLPRWSARAVVLHSPGGDPTHIGVWGISGD